MCSSNTTWVSDYSEWPCIVRVTDGDKLQVGKSPLKIYTLSFENEIKGHVIYEAAHMWWGYLLSVNFLILYLDVQGIIVTFNKG